MSKERSQEHNGSAEGPLPDLPPKDNFFLEVSESPSEELVDFHWSKRRHRIRQLVKEFSEQTHCNY